MTAHAPLSTRITSINGTGSDGWDLYRRARAMKEAGVPIVELTIGEHDIRTAPPILRAMHDAALGGHTGYPAIPGTGKLRATIAARIAERTGVPTTPANILVTPGGQSALFTTHHAACNQGDRALHIDPYYATYPGTIRAVGAVPVAIHADPARNFQPDEADLAAAAAAHAPRSLLVNSPNNPAGVVYTRDTLEGIARVVTDHDMWLISDEVYDTQVWHGTHLSPRALPGMAARTLVIGSMSKSHAMTGSRIGWCCGPEAVIGHMLDLATNTTYGVPGFVQDAAHYALGLGAAFEDEIAAPFRRRRDIVADLLSRQNVVRAAPMEGAMYALLDIRATGMTGDAFAGALLDETLIAVMPGESFGAAAAGHVRVAMTIDDARFADAMGRLLAFAAARA